MPRSAITNHEHNKSSSSTNNNDIHQHSQKRSLEDYGFFSNLKRRRHLSPQNSNIELNHDHESSSSNRKKTRTKSKNQSILNSSHDSTNDHQTPRVNFSFFRSIHVFLSLLYLENIFSFDISHIIISTNA